MVIPGYAATLTEQMRAFLEVRRVVGFIGVMGLGIILVSFIVVTIETLESRHWTFLGWSLNFGGATGMALYILGIAGEVLMISSIYLVRPVARVKFLYALIGGVTATVLWEITRRVLVWYYAAVSMVNVIYGSIAITVVALLSIEAVTVILLLGAQVIAELEHKSDESIKKKIPSFPDHPPYRP